MKNNSVKKANPEMEQALGNIDALVQQLRSMITGQADVSDQDIEEALKAMGETTEIPEGDETGHKEPDGDEGTKPVKKGLTDNPGDAPEAPRGKGDAEDTVDETHPESEDNIKEVAKALLPYIMKALKPAKQVAKSQPTGTNQVMKAMLDTLQKMNNKIESQGNVIEDMLDALGVVKSADTETVQRRESPVVTKDTNETVMQVLKALGKEEVKKGTESQADVQKSISDYLAALAKDPSIKSLYGVR